jgi:hypothetical protein
MKTFPIKNADGTTVQAEQLATFVHYIQAVQFRFVVTRGPGQQLPVVTHRASGLQVCALTVGDCMAALNDYKVAGQFALDNLIARVGAPRVRSVLAGAE